MNPPQRRSTWRAVAIAGTCTAAMLVNSSNNTSVAIALPTIGYALHARAAALQWLVSAYSLSSGCLLLFCGHLADVHGRKRVFVVGSFILFAFTLACGFVKDDVVLAVLRGLQGVGGAATIPAALGILAHEFPPSSGRARAAAFASFSAGGPVGAALGMICGGLLTQLSRYTWRAQFFLSAAIALATLILGILVIPPDAPSPWSPPPPAAPAPAPLSASASASAPNSKTLTPAHEKPPPSDPTHTYPPKSDSVLNLPARRQAKPRTDWLGAFLSAAGLVLLVFVLGQGAGPGVPPPRMPGDVLSVNMGARGVVARGVVARAYEHTYAGSPFVDAAEGPGFGFVEWTEEDGEEYAPDFELDFESEDWREDGPDEHHGHASHPPLDAHGDSDFGEWHEHDHHHPQYPPHPHHHHHPHPPPPPPPPRGFWSWLVGAPPRGPPPHRRGPPPPRGPPRGPPSHRPFPGHGRPPPPSPGHRDPQSPALRMQTDADAGLTFDEAGELRFANDAADAAPAASADLEYEYPPHHGPPHAHDPHGPPHHGPPHHHHHPPPPPPPRGFFSWLFGRRPHPHHPRPPHHWRGRNAPPGYPGYPGPPGGGPGGHFGNGPGEGWGMPYIISLLLLSLILLGLFAVWEVRLETVQRARLASSSSDDPSPHPHTTDADADAADPRRSSASSSHSHSHSHANSLPPASPKPAIPSRLAMRLPLLSSIQKRYHAYMRDAPPPLLPPSLFTRGGGRVGVVFAVAGLQFAAFMVWAFWVQLYYQVYIGYSPVRTVVRLAPMFVTGIICNVVVALIVRRVPTKIILASGTLTTAIAPLLFALIRPSAPYWAFGFPAAVCSVVGVDFLFAAGMLLVADSVGPHEQSVAGGVFQTMTQLGTSFGVTASTILFNHLQGPGGGGGGFQPGQPPQQRDGLASYQGAMWMGVGFGGLATLMALVGLRGVGTIGKPSASSPSGDEDKPAPAERTVDAAPAP